MRILMVAALPIEFPGILAHSSEPRTWNVAADWARSARVGEHHVLMVANGAGARRAAAAVDAALAGFRPDAVISTGFCGALAPAFAVADVVVGTSVVHAQRNYPALQPESSAAHHTGVVCSIDHVARTAWEKSRLRAAGASAVEMEASGVAERAEVLGLPFYCVRAVTDLAGEDMANDFNSALREDGHFDTMLILRGTLRNPWVCLPELFRLRNRCARAASVLGEFIADCRF